MRFIFTEILTIEFDLYSYNLRILSFKCLDFKKLIDFLTFFMWILSLAMILFQENIYYYIYVQYQNKSNINRFCMLLQICHTTSYAVLLCNQCSSTYINIMHVSTHKIIKKILLSIKWSPMTIHWIIFFVIIM